MTAAARLTVAAAARRALAEITALLDQIDWPDLDELAGRIVGARRVYLTGLGRSGLAARAVGMRLMHVGLDVHIVGDTTTPGIGTGDLLLAVSASGSAATVRQAKTAVGLGAQLIAITNGEPNPLEQLADNVIKIPSRTRVPTHQHAGSLFEQGTLLLGDAVCAAVQDLLHVSEADLDRRHANLA